MATAEVDLADGMAETVRTAKVEETEAKADLVVEMDLSGAAVVVEGMVMAVAN